jgi:hypothetical protein
MSRELSGQELSCIHRLPLPTVNFHARGLARKCDFFIGCGHEAQACFIDPACSVVAFICPCCLARCLKRNPKFLSLGVSLVATE